MVVALLVRTGGLSSLKIQTCNSMRNSKVKEVLVLSLKTTHQMDDSAITKLSESNIFIPMTKEEFFHVLAVK